MMLNAIVRVAAKYAPKVLKAVSSAGASVVKKTSIRDAAVVVLLVEGSHRAMQTVKTFVDMLPEKEKKPYREVEGDPEAAFAMSLSRRARYAAMQSDFLKDPDPEDSYGRAIEDEDIDKSPTISKRRVGRVTRDTLRAILPSSVSKFVGLTPGHAELIHHHKNEALKHAQIEKEHRELADESRKSFWHSLFHGTAEEHEAIANKHRALKEHHEMMASRHGAWSKEKRDKNGQWTTSFSHMTRRELYEVQMAFAENDPSVLEKFNNKYGPGRLGVAVSNVVHGVFGEPSSRVTQKGKIVPDHESHAKYHEAHYQDFKKRAEAAKKAGDKKMAKVHLQMAKAHAAARDYHRNMIGRFA